MATLLPSWPALTGHLFRQAIIFGPFCRLGGCHGRPRPAISSASPSFSAHFVGLTVVMADPDRPSLPPIHHFRPFLLAWRSFSSARPPFLPLFAGSAVFFVRRSIIFGLFCRLDGCHGRPNRPSLPPIHHFRPFLLAQRSYLSARPSFSALFVGLTVVMAGSDRPSLPSGHRIRLLLSAWWTANDLHM